MLSRVNTSGLVPLASIGPIDIDIHLDWFKGVHLSPQSNIGQRHHCQGLKDGVLTTSVTFVIWMSSYLYAVEVSKLMPKAGKQFCACWSCKGTIHLEYMLDCIYLV